MKRVKDGNCLNCCRTASWIEPLNKGKDGTTQDYVDTKGTTRDSYLRSPYQVVVVEEQEAVDNININMNTTDSTHHTSRLYCGSVRSRLQSAA